MAYLLVCFCTAVGIQNDVWEKLRHITANKLHRKCEIQDVPADGNCLFTSLALQLNRSEPDAGARVRAEIVSYLESHPEVVSNF